MDAAFHPVVQVHELVFGNDPPVDAVLDGVVGELIGDVRNVAVPQSHP